MSALKVNNGKKDAGETANLSKREKAKLEEEKLRRRTKRRTWLVVGIVLVLVAFIIFTQYGFGRRIITACVVDGEKVSVAELDYYYHVLYQQMYEQYYSYYGDYVAYFMPSTIEYCSSTDYGDGRTWAEFLIDEAENAVSGVHYYCELAAAEGYTLAGEDLETLESAEETIEYWAEYYGYGTNEYLRESYGQGMNMKLYLSILEETLIASAYRENYEAQITHTDEEALAYYEENADTLDSYTFRVEFVSLSSFESYNEDDLEPAKEELEDMFAQVEPLLMSGADFYETLAPYIDEDDECAENDEAKMTMTGSSLDEQYSEWLMDSSRKENDTYLSTTDDGAYIVQFISRETNDYLIRCFETMEYPVSVDTSEEDYEETLEAFLELARSAVGSYYTDWQSSGATVDGFKTAADEYAETSGNAHNVYEDVEKGTYGELTDWLYDDERKPGDHTALYCEELGSYVVAVYTQDGENARISIASETMIEEEYNAWFDSHETIREGNYSCKEHLGIKLLG